MGSNSATGRDGVLIVGAGPTGLVLALWLARLGIRARIIDRTSGPGTTSRAVAVQARTLELYRQVGLADAVVARGRRALAVNLWVAGRKVARGVFGEMGTGISPFPYALIYPQDEHERLLISGLGEAGVEVERETELLAFEEASGRVRARIRRKDGAVEDCETAYLAGCDGAHSIVREKLDVAFPGGVYSHLFYVADVEGSGPAMDGEVHVALNTSDFLALFPLLDEGRARLVGTVRPEAEQPGETLSWDDVGKDILAKMRIDVRRVNWFSTYHVHHRVAGSFRVGRVFLVGDAAHIHSPVGGQGMNTGIGDAVNLGWKLASVLHGRADPSLLETFEPERIAFARRLVATTDRVFTAVTSPGAIARLIRLNVVPLLLPAVFRSGAFRRLAFRTVSQTSIEYRSSRLARGRAGGVRGGDRLPWIPGVDRGGGDNFAPLASLDWQVHVYGDAGSDLRAACDVRMLPLHVFPWREEMARAGVKRDASYLVRPDGYVALADPSAAAAALESYLDEHRFRPSEPDSAPARLRNAAQGSRPPRALP